MPSPSDPNKLSLHVGGVSHSDWLDFDIDADLLVPAGAWVVSLGIQAGKLPAEVQAGARVVLRAGDDVLMTGFIDEIQHTVNRNQHTIVLNGRDNAAILVDCSAPIFTATNMTLQEVITQVVRPLGAFAVRIQSAQSTAAKKFSVEPGEGAWDTLKKAAEVCGLWPWVAADGTLIIGGPDYSAPPVAQLTLLQSGQGNNLLDLRVTRDMSRRYSQTTVLGQSHGSHSQDGKRNRRCTVRDTSMTLYRPRVVVVSDVDSDAEVQFRARKLQADARLSGLTITAEVKGFRTPAGVLWAPGQRVSIKSDVHGIDDVFYLMHRRFRGGRGMPMTTVLTLHEDGVWLPDAFPRSKRQRKGKGKTGLWTSWEQIDNG
ncbi:phage tail protein [Serratia marcescens]|uniref:Phage tail protein n=1 Tax=Serratia marcescens TaxID=615 RepID=A0A5C7BSD6_SERMA|nr:MULTISPECIES: tail protein [Serratia]TXE27153.1 phage tail protein [Serratia marcescens]TXE55290.1 phage tail protein [Serratia marcescens]